jgi:NADPH:quinone reductase-like Zn-dependent oxidoreductase
MARGELMKAIVQDGYGSTERLSLQEIEKPVAAKGEVLVRVHAASVHPDVWHVLTGLPYALRLMGAGMRRPRVRVPGTDVAGTVEAVGEDVTRFARDDAVFGETVRGHQWKNGGAYAEYVAVPERQLEPKPDNVSFEQAAAVPTSGLVALDCLCDQGNVQKGQRVLINGAAGGVGAFAVQLAKASGAEVTGVDRTGKLDVIETSGADHVIDYRYEDFTQSGDVYDLIVDVAGGHSLKALKRSLGSDGTYVFVGHDRFGEEGGRWFGLSLRRFVSLAVRSMFASQQITPRRKRRTKDPLAVLAAHIEAGRLRPVVDRTYPLSQTAEAIDDLTGGKARGKLVISVRHPG